MHISIDHLCIDPHEQSRPPPLVHADVTDDSDLAVLVAGIKAYEVHNSGAPTAHRCQPRLPPGENGQCLCWPPHLSTHDVVHMQDRHRYVRAGVLIVEGLANDQW